MKINKKIAAFVLIILVITWAGNIYYYKTSQLKRPLFLKHYYDIEKGMTDFSLYYIDNIFEERGKNITMLKFPEVSNVPIYFSKYEEEKYGSFYKMTRILIPLQDPYTYNILKNRIITKAEITLSNGKNFIIPIGKIYISGKTYGEKVHKFYKGKFKSIDSGSNLFDIYIDTKVNGVYCRFPKLAASMLKASINGKAIDENIFPLSCRAGNRISFNYQFIQPDYKTKTIACDFPIYLQIQDVNGKIEYNRCYIHSKPYDINRKTVLQILENERGE